ncbi:hypothetical protein AMJ47_03545 [Parcubacteria bacterium DG_72]|nr:MAG: hypothetical protein AMJ47_03545 [Parcubacteria bacterium DG_72]
MEQKNIKINKVMLLIGIVIIIIAASMMFCQERCFLRVDLELWPAALGIIGIVLISTSAVLGMFKKTPMEQENKKPNRVMFWIGIVIVVITVILLLTGEGEELRIWPIPFGIMGIVFIGISRYRPLKKLF